MKARIEKKLSKRIVLLYPSLYGRSWIDEDHSELAYEQRTRVSHVPSVGGEYCSYSGDCNDTYSAWDDWCRMWPWHGLFKDYPEGHEHEYFPNTEGFNPTTRNLLKLAAECELAERARK